MGKPCEQTDMLFVFDAVMDTHLEHVVASVAVPEHQDTWFGYHGYHDLRVLRN